MAENELIPTPCPYRNRCAFVDESCSEEKSRSCDVLTKTKPKMPRHWDPDEPVAVTMTRDQWLSVIVVAKTGADRSACQRIWWQECCADRRMGQEKAAQYAADEQAYESMCKIIEDTIYAEKENE